MTSPRLIAAISFALFATRFALERRSEASERPTSTCFAVKRPDFARRT
jgi:hypothetical protein